MSQDDIRDYARVLFLLRQRAAARQAQRKLEPGGEESSQSEPSSADSNGP